MNYNNPQLQTLLAAEYVLGTLRGKARARYERLRDSLPALQREQQYWETRLSALGLKLAPQDPPPAVWQRIEQRARVKTAVTPPAALWDRAGFWQFVSMAAALAAITMGVLLRQVPVDSGMDYVAIVQADQGDSLWMISADMRRGQLRCKSMGERYPVAADQDLELWLMVDDDDAPVSLGVLPKKGEMMMPLKPALMAKFARASGLVVSLEPVGGSRTGAPSGPMLFSAPPPLPT